MESGTIVEYIERQKIMCAVVLEVKNKRLRVLTENDREVNLSASRLSHKCNMRLDLSRGRVKTVETLKEIANRRDKLINDVDIRELWEVLNPEQEWVDLATMTEFCFPEGPSYDHESAVVRAFFKNRLYFKFNADRFFPYSEEQVDRLAARHKEEERQIRIVQGGADWLKSILSNRYDPAAGLTEEEKEFAEILKSTYLFEKESPHYAFGKEMMSKAGVNDFGDIFSVLVKVGLWDENENTDLLRYDIPIEFSRDIVESAEKLVKEAVPSSFQAPAGPRRRDLSHLDLMTIDGQSTLDYDDALSLEKEGDFYRIGVHIIDVGHYIKKGDRFDREALKRSSSIYTPDIKIPMLPSCFAEDLCSLKAGELRPAISTMVRMNPVFDIVDFDIFPSLVRVDRQLTYYDVNTLADENPDIITLRDIASKFRKYRMDAAALQINLPEIHVWIGEDGEIKVNRINRESPGRMLVSEFMIMANWLMARFLSQRGLPAIYRSQPKPRERLYKGDEGSLFQNIMQRRLLSRFVLSDEPDHHSGLGLSEYVTGTSPIRKFCDLTTQRQIRAAHGLEEPYSAEEIDKIIQQLEQPMGIVSRIQHRRLRYWILKYLEKMVGQKEEAIVLARRRKSYQVLIPEYMIECDLPITSGIGLNPEDLIQVTIQRVRARKDVLTVFMG